MIQGKTATKVLITNMNLLNPSRPTSEMYGNKQPP